MDSKGIIDRLVQETLDSATGIEAFKTPPFFKDKVLNRMAQVSEKQSEGVAFLNWFTPKYQAIALVCFIVLNGYALLSYSTDSYGENVENFAEAYGLLESTTESYLYEN